MHAWYHSGDKVYNVKHQHSSERQLCRVHWCAKCGVCRLTIVVYTPGKGFFGFITGSYSKQYQYIMPKLGATDTWHHEEPSCWLA
jgi:hypothetical protein